MATLDQNGKVLDDAPGALGADEELPEVLVTARPPDWPQIFLATLFGLVLAKMLRR